MKILSIFRIFPLRSTGNHQPYLSVQSISDSANEVNKAAPILAIQNLHLRYGHGKRQIHAVRGVSFTIPKGETLSLVGESGSGKSSIAKAILKLTPIHSGRIFFDGTDITDLNRKAFFPFRKKMQLIFQDPWNSLNPKATIEDILREPLRIHFPEQSKTQHLQRIRDLLDQVHLPNSTLERYPSNFSGGQRQRIVIARALAVEPELLICDEPVSALDVSIQAKILELLMEMSRNLNLSMLFISHDLAVVQQITQSIVVMKSGQIEETASVKDLFSNPQSAYTKTLIEACPQW